MLVESIEFRAGSSAGKKPLEIKRPKFTVFVGPNNSGKSQVLRDIQNWCTSGPSQEPTVLCKAVMQTFSSEEANQIRQSFRVKQLPNEHLNEGHSFYSIGGNRFQAHDSSFQQCLQSPNITGKHLQWFASYYARHLTLNLNGANRLAQLNQQNRGDLKAPTTTFAKLFIDDKARLRVRNSVHEALNMYFGFDAFYGDKLSVRFGLTPPPDERSLKEDVRQWMIDAKPIEEVSDGVKAFTGILIELAVGDPRTILIDEPEAFLHPALAFKLGKEIASVSRAEDKQVFVATHSPQFLMGAIQSGAEVNVVRLTYQNNVGTARLLPTDQLQLLMRDPLLRSANILAGVFHEYVVVTEADADRAFYQEINDRLNDADGFEGIPNALFLNANGKDTLHRLAGPLRALGVPVAAIADIDVLREGGKKWTNHLDGYFVPSTQHDSLGTFRKSVWTSLVDKDENPKRKGALGLLDGEELEAAKNLLSELQKYGFFIVEIGEVEHWLSTLEVPTSKHTWLRNVFEAMGDDPKDLSYARPAKEDVWAFLADIRVWLMNESRLGIPK